MRVCVLVIWPAARRLRRALCHSSKKGPHNFQEKYLKICLSFFLGGSDVLTQELF
jgi:hypothetical protein